MDNPLDNYLKEHEKLKGYVDYKTIGVLTKDKNNKIKCPTRIDSTLKNINNKAYIPGSSIKGSIKTAIIYDYLNKENPKNIEGYKDTCNSKDIDKIMTKMSVSDSSEYKNNIRTVQILPFTLTHENDKNKNKDSNKEDMYNAIECLNPYKLKIELKLFEDNLKTINYVKECLYSFNDDYITHELRFFRKMHEKEKDAGKKGNITKIIEFYEDLNNKNSEKSPLIRLGGSTGLLSTSIALHMKNNNPQLYHQIYKPKDNKNKKGGRRSNRKNTNNEEYPKIRQISPNNESFGWCRLSSI